MNKLPYNFAKKHNYLATIDANSQIIVYYLEPLNFTILGEIQRFLQTEFTLQAIAPEKFQQYLEQCYQSQINLTDITLEENLTTFAAQLPINDDLLDNTNEAPIIRLINAIFTQAIKSKASDIHIETYENRILIRNRIDGILHEILEIQRAAAPLIISRIKVMAKLDIAERRIPQDGRITLQRGGHSIDIRVSTLPANHGERIVLRILDQHNAPLDLNLLGLSPIHLMLLKQIITNPHGIILITGPTGSGKTTTLYAMLSELNQMHRNILTIEDPIEYNLPGIGQMQVNNKIGMTFAKGLRAILRQDPDIVMIGEIRDRETAEIAIQASLTGHLVLSTMHTNSALGAITRLNDMGVEPFLLASSLVGLIAQRLIRKLCDQCKKPHNLNAEEQELLNMHSNNYNDICMPSGCDACNYTGYTNRTGIYDIINIDTTLQRLIHRNENIQDIEAHARKFMPNIMHQGFNQVITGNTSLAEVLRVCRLGLEPRFSM